MSNQNRFLLPHAPACSPGTSTSGGASTSATTSSATAANVSYTDDQENQHSVDTDFDSYWEEEARNPHRNRIRIGRQYQATVPPLLKPGESDQRKLADLETLTFCPKLSAKVSNSELDFYFTVAKSLNLFASLVQTRSLLGRDVTIADLNHIKTKEGLSLASVIQPTRQTANYGFSSQSSQQHVGNSSVSPTKSSPPSSTNQASQDNKPSSSTSASSPNAELTSAHQQSSFDTSSINQPLVRALSHFISLHHPCHHDKDCKKLNKKSPIEDDPGPPVSITAGNLRQTTSASSSPAKSRSRSALVAESSTANQTDLQDSWTREEIELFSKAIEVCGKNFGSIKKEFLPTKSVRSIVEYYYIGSRDMADNKKKSSQTVDLGDNCNNSVEKMQTNSLVGCGGGVDADDSGSGPSTASMNGKQTSTSNSTTTNRRINNSESESRSSTKSMPNSHKMSTSSASQNQKETKLDARMKSESTGNNVLSRSTSSTPSKPRTTPKNIDARMSVYNFDEDFKDESPIKLECPPRPGAEVKPLKAKPIVPNASSDGEASNSNVGSLKFFMDGQLVLKLNACQDHQEGAEKCHWVQSEKVATQNRQKRYSKRANSDNRAPSELSLNGSQSNSVVSSNADEDSKNDDLTFDEDSKESANSFPSTNAPTPPRPKKQTTPKRHKTSKTSNDPASSATSASNQAAPSISPIDYNRMAIENLMKERNDSNNLMSQTPIGINNNLMSQATAAAAAAASMPNWLQANQFAVAAAILGGLPFPTGTAAGNLIQTMSNNNMGTNNHLQAPPPAAVVTNNSGMAINMATSKPMDLSLEHSPTKPISTQSGSRSRGKQKN